jgi:hypothetical protein
MRNYIKCRQREVPSSRCQPRGFGQDCKGGAILLLLRETTHYALFNNVNDQVLDLYSAKNCLGHRG